MPAGCTISACEDVGTLTAAAEHEAELQSGNVEHCSHGYFQGRSTNCCLSRAGELRDLQAKITLAKVADI
jgi:hypothetical protein